MAASMDLFSSKMTLFSRNVLTSLKQIRLCHVSVQESATSSIKPKQSQPSLSSMMSKTSVKPSRNRLLSDRVPSSVTAYPFGIVRPYSALSQRAIFTTPVWEHNEATRSSTNQRKCWNCGKETDTVDELFFCHCGVVQTPADKMTFFTLFGIDEGFDVDVKKLGQVYKDLQKRLHPDMFSLKSETEQSLAERQSSLLNKAYFTLLKPLSRALYILEQHGFIIEEGTTEMDPEFLMEVMDLNECIGESTSDDIQEIEDTIASKIQKNVDLLAQAFAKKDYKTAKDIAVRLQYYVNVESKIKLFYRDRM